MTDSVDELFAEWYDRRERGAAESIEELAARHPDLSDLLRERVAALELLDDALGAVPSEGPPPDRIGPYRIGELLGAGAMGTVYRAELSEPAAGLEAGASVALKVLHPSLLARPGAFKRFLREAALGRRVVHPGVVRTFDADALLEGDRLHHFLVMEHVEGQTLREAIDELERLPEELCRRIGHAVSEALAAIHSAGAVHRDLKPENVLIGRDHAVKIMDLGVALFEEEAIRLSRTGAFVGSIHYAAPEQLSGEAEVDHRADLHALGVVLYEIAAGRHPFYDGDHRVAIRRLVDEDPRRLGEVNPEASPFLEELVHALLAKDREKRPGAAAEVAAILAEGEASPWWRDRARMLREETRRPLRRIRLPRETALHGRDRELRRLEELFADAASGEGRVVLLRGEAGVGKTRLVDELAGGLRANGMEFDFLHGSSPPGGAATATGALATALREHLGERDLAASLARLLPATPDLVPAFAALLRGEARPAGEEGLTRESIRTLFVHATRALAAVRPLLILVDDLHFAGDEGRALFAALALAILDHPVLLVGTARPGLPDGWLAEVQRPAHASLLELPRLGPKDLMRLLSDAFRSEALARELGHEIAVKSDGNPYFAFEILRGLRDGRYLTRRPDGTWARTRRIDRIEIPSSVMDLIRARIAELDEEDEELLDVAACDGFSFDPVLVAAALGMDAIAAMRRLARIEKRHRLVRSAGRRFVFDHHQVHEALYRGLPAPLRERYHSALATALGSAGEGSVDPVALCGHLLAGTRPDEAHPHLLEALDRLEAGSRHELAADLAGRALAAGPRLRGEERIDLLLRRAACLASLGRSAEERDALDEALELAENLREPGRLARVRIALGSHLDTAARWDEARQVLERAVEDARRVGSRRLEARAMMTRGYVLARLGQFEDARDALERSVARAREGGDRRDEGKATSGLGTVLFRLGRTAEARERLEQAISIARETRDRQGEAAATGNLGNLLWSLGDAAGALERQERALALAREIGSRRGESIALGNLGNALSALGRYDEARACHERNLELARETGNRMGEAYARHNLGMELARLGDVETARGQVMAARTIARDLGVRPLEPHGALALATLVTDPEKARGHLEEAVSLAHDLGAKELLVEALTALGALDRREHRPDEAIRRLEEALAIEGIDAPGGSVLALAQRAVLPGGDAPAARDALGRHAASLSHEQRQEAHFLLWQATSDAAHLEAAGRLLDAAIAHAPESRRAAMLERVPVHRAIERARRESR